MQNEIHKRVVAIVKLSSLGKNQQDKNRVQKSVTLDWNLFVSLSVLIESSL